MNIAIIGLGWLGMPLAEHFISQGHQVIGTNRIPTKRGAEIPGLVIARMEWTAPKALNLLEILISEVDVVLFTLPPTALRTNDVENRFASFAKMLRDSKAKRAIMISSTSVFGNVVGEVDENTKPEPVSDSGILLVKLEQIWKKYLGIKSIVIRPGGLIGPHRNPINYLSGSTGINGPDLPVNLVYLDDLINVLYQAAICDKHLPVYHAVASQHPTREMYYCGIAKKMKMPIPEFDMDDLAIGKIVKSEISTQFLNLKYKYDDPFEMV